jgi:hypothetical protein
VRQLCGDGRPKDPEREKYLYKKQQKLKKRLTKPDVTFGDIQKKKICIELFTQ